MRKTSAKKSRGKAHSLLFLYCAAGLDPGDAGAGGDKATIGVNPA